MKLVITNVQRFRTMYTVLVPDYFHESTSRSFRKFITIRPFYLIMPQKSRDRDDYSWDDYKVNLSLRRLVRRRFEL